MDMIQYPYYSIGFLVLCFFRYRILYERTVGSYFHHNVLNPSWTCLTLVSVHLCLKLQRLTQKFEGLGIYRCVSVSECRQSPCHQELIPRTLKFDLVNQEVEDRDYPELSGTFALARLSCSKRGHTVPML